MTCTGTQHTLSMERWKSKQIYTDTVNIYILSSRQIFGPITFAAPEIKRNARCLGGHGAERPHLYLCGDGSKTRDTDSIVKPNFNTKYIMQWSRIVMFVPVVDSSCAPVDQK